MANEGLNKNELFARLAAYRVGRLSLAALIGWEAQYALDDSVASEFRTTLDRVALLAAEAADGIRPESELRDLVAELLLPDVLPPEALTMVSSSVVGTVSFEEAKAAA